MRVVTLILFLLAFAVFSSDAVAQGSATPKGWRKVTACEFSFLVPEETRQRPTSPVDSCLAAFEYKDLSISLDYGWYSAPESEEAAKFYGLKNYRSQDVTINGREATLITYDDAMRPNDISSVTKIHVITSRSTKSPTIVSLLMSFQTKGTSNVDVIKQIYESLKFVGK